MTPQEVERVMGLERRRKKKRYHWLAAVIRVYGYTTGAEVGAATGNTTQVLLDRCRNLEKLIIVDLWERIPGAGSNWDRDDMEDTFRARFKGEKRLTIFKGISWEMAKFVDDYSLDFVFIDAAHDYNSVSNDIAAWITKIKPGGMICGHDINLKGVKRAVEDHLINWEEAGVDHMWYKFL